MDEDDIDMQRLIPRLYILLNAKTQHVYERVFDEVMKRAELIHVEVEWEASMTDFETGLLAALNTKFPPNFKKHGCHFHFCQAVYR